uniref:Uncharacterized protein n=1 Tax=Siphoviridae sp. ctiJm4 TaxID=2827916 RepID=A0A8S5T1W6_9CAUD|nr:MAG TPA: hypothetical protein [Siphoviridae sp. ctiJm4]
MKFFCHFKFLLFVESEVSINCQFGSVNNYF